jgi:hypothetical protein
MRPVGVAYFESSCRSSGGMFNCGKVDIALRGIWGINISKKKRKRKGATLSSYT